MRISSVKKMLNMAGPARVQQLIQQARTTFSKPKGEPSFLEEFERLKSVVSEFMVHFR